MRNTIKQGAIGKYIMTRHESIYVLFILTSVELRHSKKFLGGIIYENIIYREFSIYPCYL